ncbi:MAG: hemerythrin domain-containing protein [Gallionella sp.]
MHLKPEWDAERHTLGIPEIDRAHIAFIELVAALIDATDAQFPAMFQSLISHTSAHFKEEGQLMRSSKYPGLAIHEGEHHRVLGELQQLNRSMLRGRLPLVRAFVKHGLTEWFNVHLSMMDTAMVIHLRNSQGAKVVA